MSVLRYNGVFLKEVTTNRFAQEAVYDKTGQDYLYTRFIINVTAYVNPGFVADNPLTPQSDDFPADQMVGDMSNYTSTGNPLDGLRAKLLSKGKELKFGLGDLDEFAADQRVLMISPNPGINADANNGPFPRKCNITQVVGSRTLIIEYEIETYKYECGESNALPTVTSNRWKNHITIDENWYSTRTVSGELRIRGGSEQPNADAIARAAYLPPTPAGFRRMNIDIVQEESGLAFQYTVVDREMVRLIDPNNQYGITKIEASYTESLGMAPNPGGAGVAGIINCDVEVTVFGNKNANRKALAQVGIEIALSRIGETAGGLGNQASGMKPGQVSGFSVREDLMNNVIAVRGRVFRTQDDFIKAGIVASKASIIGLELLPYTRTGVNNDPPARGTAGLTAVVQVLSGDCGEAKKFPSTGIDGDSGGGGDFESGDGDEEEQSSFTASVKFTTVSVLDAFSQSPLSEGQRKTPFTDYRITRTIITEETVIPGIVASSAGITKRIQVAGGASKLIINWTAERLNEVPIIPHPTIRFEVAGITAFLIDKQIDPQSPEITKDVNGIVRRISGRYVYALDRKLDFEKQQIFMGHLPSNSIPSEFQVVPVASYQRGLIDNVGPAGSQGGGQMN